MFIEERHREILNIIKRNGRISVSEIQSKFGVSLDSARRDLRILEQKALLKRTHGGAVSINGVNINTNKNRTIKTSLENMEVYDNYAQIAETAAKQIEGGDVIYLTNSSLGFLMLRYMPQNIEYTVVVNSATLADELKYRENLTVYVVGGKMRMNSSTSIVDALATHFVENMSFDKAFITGNGVTSDYGFTAGTEDTALFQRAIINNTLKSYLLIPSQKIGFQAFIKVCDVSSFYAVITDMDKSEEELSKISNKGVKLL